LFFQTFLSHKEDKAKGWTPGKGPMMRSGLPRLKAKDTDVQAPKLGGAALDWQFLAKGEFLITGTEVKDE